MKPVDALLEDTAAPERGDTEFLDARELPPPQPLQETLERLEAADDDLLFVQLNDRRPQFLYPQLDDRGYQYETHETRNGILTVIWRD